MDRFTEMEMFVKVVEHGGFTEAARRCGVSKSAVSKQISALEQRLGARLLNRTTRRVSPTEIGLSYYDRATRVLAEMQEADAVAAMLQGAPRGELRVSAPHSFGLRRIAPLLGGFLSENEEISIRMNLDDRCVELISEGYDLAIRIGALPDSSLKARRIGSAALVLVASPDYLERRGAPAAIEDLADHELLHYSYLASGRNWLLRAPNGSTRQVRASGRLTVNNGEALLTAVEDGLGVALTPDFICQDSLDAGRCVSLLPSSWPEPLGIWAVTPPGEYAQPKVRSFVDYLAARLKQDESVAAAAE